MQSGGPRQRFSRPIPPGSPPMSRFGMPDQSEAESFHGRCAVAAALLPTERGERTSSPRPGRAGTGSPALPLQVVTSLRALHSSAGSARSSTLLDQGAERGSARERVPERGDACSRLAGSAVSAGRRSRRPRLFTSGSLPSGVAVSCAPAVSAATSASSDASSGGLGSRRGGARLVSTADSREPRPPSWGDRAPGS